MKHAMELLGFYPLPRHGYRKDFDDGVYIIIVKGVTKWTASRMRNGIRTHQHSKVFETEVEAAKAALIRWCRNG